MSSDNLKPVKIDLVEVLINTETDEIFVGRCPECSNLLTADEMSYGHDCE